MFISPLLCFPFLISLYNSLVSHTVAVLFNLKNQGFECFSQHQVDINRNVQTCESNQTISHLIPSDWIINKVCKNIEVVHTEHDRCVIEVL